MKVGKCIFKSSVFLGLTLMLGTGCYNAFVINSDSGVFALSGHKRLDEMLGSITAGRTIAVEKKWQKMAFVKTTTIKPSIKNDLGSSIDTMTSEVATSFIQEELQLSLSEVINPKKWNRPLNSKEYSGQIIANNGIIETLNVSLPDTEAISVSFGELTGNVFEYEHGGQVYSGLMYQVDVSSYMVTLTNGPLEGTRLKFNGQVQDNQNLLAESETMKPGNFGSEEVFESTEETIAEVAPSEPQNVVFNFGTQSI